MDCATRICNRWPKDYVWRSNAAPVALRTLHGLYAIRTRVNLTGCCYAVQHRPERIRYAHGQR
jgi:hypothetical protein